MANHMQTMKRHVEDINSSNNENSDDENDVTWGGKRCRYIYNYTLQSPNNLNIDSDETESVISGQSKSTIVIVSSDDCSSESCGTDCDCKNSSQSTILTEYELVTSSSHHFIDSNSSDSSSIFDDEVKKIDVICDTDTQSQIKSDPGYLPDDHDNEVSVPKTKLPPPACFKTCLQCLKENSNPYFQYCHTCFKYRMEFFGSKPKPKPKKLKGLNVSNRKSEGLKDSQDSGISNSQHSNEIGASSLFLNKNVENNTPENICNICFILPKNGVFNHGKISHVVGCYSCAKIIWRKNNKCPICNVKVKFVSKMIVV